MIKNMIVLVLASFLGACSSTPVLELQPQDLILLPSDPEKNLEVDEQFLHKSQRIGATGIGRSARKVLLNP